MPISTLPSQKLMRLSQANKKPQRPDEESSRPVLAAGCCIDFHPVRLRPPGSSLPFCLTGHEYGVYTAYRFGLSSFQGVHHDFLRNPLGIADHLPANQPPATVSYRHTCELL